MHFYNDHARLYVAVDCIIFGYDIADKAIKLLLIKRDFEPAKGKWSLAGGFVRPEESLDNAAGRILTGLTGLKDVYMEQLGCFGAVKRDPAARVVSVAFWALIEIDEINKSLAVKYGAHWQSVSRLPELIFDHPEMVSQALAKLEMQIRIKPVGFELLPEKFTLVQLLDLYTAIYRRSIDKRNFRRKIISMNVLEKQDDKEKETSKKGAYYYRFIKERYAQLTKGGFDFRLDVN
jgi:8-oxo-dGTP diphosphatase